MNLRSIFGIESLEWKFFGKVPPVCSLTFHAFLNSNRIEFYQLLITQYAKSVCKWTYHTPCFRHYLIHDILFQSAHQSRNIAYIVQTGMSFLMHSSQDKIISILVSCDWKSLWLNKWVARDNSPFIEGIHWIASNRAGTIEHITYSSTFELGSRHKHRILKMSWYEVSFQNSLPPILFFACYCSYCSCLMLSLSRKIRWYNHFLVLISRLLRCLREGWGVCASAMSTEDNCAKVKLRKHKNRNTYRTYSAVPTTIPVP